MSLRKRLHSPWLLVSAPSVMTCRLRSCLDVQIHRFWSFEMMWALAKLQNLGTWSPELDYLALPSPREL